MKKRCVNNIDAKMDSEDKDVTTTRDRCLCVAAAAAAAALAAADARGCTQGDRAVIRTRVEAVERSTES